MEDSTKNEIMTDVRKAYRLLFEYQTRLLALVKFIGGKYGFDYHGGYPRFSNNQPRQGSGSLDFWAWDWLNLYFHEFRFTTNENHISFSVFALNDDGFYQSCQEAGCAQDKLNTQEFKLPEQSNSKLILVASYQSWIVQFPIAALNWNTVDFTLTDKGTQTNDKGVLFFKSYAIEHFFNQNDALIQLADFEKECQNHGIPLKQIVLEKE